jgi:hypothetical protein
MSMLQSSSTSPSPDRSLPQLPPQDGQTAPSSLMESFTSPLSDAASNAIGVRLDDAAPTILVSEDRNAGASVFMTTVEATRPSPGPVPQLPPPLLTTLSPTSKDTLPPLPYNTSPRPLVASNNPILEAILSPLPTATAPSVSRLSDVAESSLDFMMIEMVHAVERLTCFRKRNRSRRHTADDALSNQSVDSDDDLSSDGMDSGDEDAGAVAEKESIFFTLESMGYQVGQRLIERYEWRYF